MDIRIDTLIGHHVMRGDSVRTARACARSWLRKYGYRMGGGRDASVSVGVPGGRWHKIGLIGNPHG